MMVCLAYLQLSYFMSSFAHLCTSSELLIPIKKCNDTFPIKSQRLLLENPTCNKCYTRFLKQIKASIGHCTVYSAITFNSFMNVISFLRKGFYYGDKILSIFN